MNELETLENRTKQNKKHLSAWNVYGIHDGIKETKGLDQSKQTFVRYSFSSRTQRLK